MFSIHNQSSTKTTNLPPAWTPGRSPEAFDSELIIRDKLRPSIADRALSMDERREVLTRAWKFINIAIGRASSSSVSPDSKRTLGIEIEAALLHQDGQYAEGSAPAVLKALRSQQRSGSWNAEAGSGSVEFASSPYLMARGNFDLLLRDTKSAFQRAATLARQQGQILLSTGIVPVLGHDQVDKPSMASKTPEERAIEYHWAAINAEREKRLGGLSLPPIRRSVTLEMEGGSSYEMTTNASAWSTINALHVTFQALGTSDALHLFNGLRALQPMMFAISANTGTLNGRDLAYEDYRPLIIAGSGPLEFNFETCTGLVTEYASSLREAFLQVIPTMVTDPCPMISLTSGERPSLRDAFESIRESVFPSIQLRFHPKQPGVILVEYRPLSVQLSVELNVAVTNFLALAADYAARNPELVHHISRESMISESILANQSGPDAEITVPIGANRGKRMPAAAAALEVWDELVQGGVRKGSIGVSDFAVLEPLRQNLRERLSSTRILRRDIAAYGLEQALQRHKL